VTGPRFEPGTLGTIASYELPPEAVIEIATVVTVHVININSQNNKKSRPSTIFIHDSGEDRSSFAISFTDVSVSG